ncbi:transposase [Rhizobium sp. BK529]|nr:transposase [Rhizobium sp. BK529]TCS02278.1 homeodomain-containing protein [Rhizobium sp. BK418]
MPWTSVMEERLRFVARLLEGEGMSDVCREFGISRKTGYKIFNRYKDDGLEALTDRSRRPVRYANQLPEPVEAMIVRLRQEKPHWGARKIRELLVKRLAGDVRVPSKSTVHAVLDRHGLVAHARKRHDGIWLVSFMHYDLGYIDLEQRTLQTIDNPFGTRLSPMS